MSGASEEGDQTLARLRTIEDLPPSRSSWASEVMLADATKQFVRAVAQRIESLDTAFPDDGALGTLARRMETDELNDLMLRFGRAAILRMAKAGEPNKAFGFIKKTPGNTGDPFRFRVEAAHWGAYVERERRLNRSIEAAMDAAAARYGVSKSTVRNRLKLICEAMDCSDTENEKALEAFYKGQATDTLVCDPHDSE